MKKIIFATGNANKMVEVRMILADCGYEIVSMKEAGIDIDIVEDGKTFEENAIIKRQLSVRQWKRKAVWFLPTTVAWKLIIWMARRVFTLQDGRARIRRTASRIR